MRWMIVAVALLWSVLAQAQTQVINVDEIRAPASLSLDAASNNILPVLAYDQNLGSLQLKFLSLHAAELWVETLVAQNTLATIGGRILVGPTTTLTANLGDGAGDTTITVKHNDLASGDRVVLEANGKIEFLAITSAPSGGGPYSYTVTRNLDGSGRDLWYAGDAVFSTGTTGDGFIDLYSVRGVSPTATAYGPTIVGNIRLSSTYNDWAPRWAVGNLDGLYGYTGSTYGAAFGDPADAHLTIDSTNGIRMLEGGYTRAQWEVDGDLSIGVTTGTSGNLFISNAGTLYARSGSTAGVTVDSTGVLVGEEASGKSNVKITAGSLKLRTNTDDKITLDTSGNLKVLGNLDVGTAGSFSSGATAWGTGTGWWMEYNAGSPRLRLGTVSGDRIEYSSSGLYLKATNLIIDSNGIELPTGSWSMTRAYGFSDNVSGMGYNSDNNALEFKSNGDISWFTSDASIYMHLRGGTTDALICSACSLGASTLEWKSLYLYEDIYHDPTDDTSDFNPIVFDSSFGVYREKTDGKSVSGTTCTITAIESGIVTGATCT